MSALLGARIFSVVLNPQEFENVGWVDRRLRFAPNGAYRGVVGLSVMGGLPLALVSGYLFLRLRCESWWPTMDVMAPSVALGAGITRVGCFMNGCCHGRECNWPWAIRFPPESLPSVTLPGVAIHPAQIYAAIASYLIFIVLVHFTRRKPPPGSIVAGLCIAMGGQRFVIEGFRSHSPSEAWMLPGDVESTVYHVVAAGLVVVGISLFALASRQQRIRVRVAGSAR